MIIKLKLAINQRTEKVHFREILKEFEKWD